MGEKSTEIERHIQNQRNELGEHIGELTEKVQSAVDWRAQVEERPFTMIGLAFGGGLLLSALAPGRPRYKAARRSTHDDFERTSRDSASIDADFKSQPATSHSSANLSKTLSKASDTLENVKGALIGVAAAKVVNYLEQIIPGFNDEYKKSEARKGSIGTSQSSDATRGWNADRL